MTLIEHVHKPPLIEETLRKRDRERFIKTRLMHVYSFAQQFIGNDHLDIGTYDGFALKTISEAANHITSFDISADILKVAQTREDVQELIQEKRLALLQMDARYIGIPHDSFDSATLIEVLGGAFEGSRQDIHQMFSEAKRVLKPYSPFIFTIKSRSNEQILRQYFDWEVPKGYPQYRPEMEELLCESGFGPVSWYGHVFMTLTPSGNPILPLRVTDRDLRQHVDLAEQYFIPQPAQQFEGNGQTKYPLYWIGVSHALD